MNIKEYKTGSDITLIFLNGLGNPNKEERCFEWEKATEYFRVNRLFVQDVLLAWYQDSIDILIPHLKEKTKGQKVLTVGASMGGYAALLIAHELGCGSLAFAPQTNIKKDFLEKYDRRWIKNLTVANGIAPFPEYLDLSFIKGTQHHIFYSMHVPEDVLHATRMNVALFPIDCEVHNVAGHLKGLGLLQRILLKRVEGLHDRIEPEMVSHACVQAWNNA